MPASTSKIAARAAAVLGVVGTFVSAPAVALACPVCGASTADNAWAYTVMSAMLTVLPLGMIGAVVFWVAKRAAAVDAGQPHRDARVEPGDDHVPQHQTPVQLRPSGD